ncbi:MAG: AI-2E family transporter [Firmicutes bacterium]|nr:AI-2E family transporter [Bacillota bacterium]
MARAGAVRLLVLAAAVLALRWALGWAAPLVLALALAAVLEGPVGRVAAATGMGRAAAAAVVLGGWVLLLAVLAAYLAAHLVTEVASLHALAPALAAALRRAVARALSALGPPQAWPEPLASAVRGEGGALAGFVSRAAVRAAGALAAVPRLAAGAGFAVVAAYLLLVEGPLGPRLRAALAPWPGAADALAVLSLGAQAAWRLASAELALASFSAAASTVVFWLLAAPVPIVLGLMAGLLDLVPYAGPAVLLLPWSAYLLVAGHGGRALGVAGAWLALAAVRGVLELRWVGRGVGLSTLWVVVSFYLGARLMGLTGLVLGPVVAAAVWAVWRQDGGAAAGQPPAADRAARTGARRRWA